MNLIIDVGNTRIKLGFFENKTLKNFFVITSVNELFNHPEFLSLLNQTHKVIISNVTNVELTEFFKKNCYNSPIIQLTSSIPLPFQIDYETPHTLGQDRLAAVAGAVSEFPNTNLLIIDFGTCIKYNVCSNNVFMGGAISPGLQTRYNALHHYT
ncbi:type III pantothenate kinase, partial [Thermaurantimonas aggregans]|uniref:type III pantothenate kinase n=1 Tax=Thermaurantimonas aggregans TaxID=2173829 RepID=UPI0023F293EB